MADTFPFLFCCPSFPRPLCTQYSHRGIKMGSSSPAVFPESIGEKRLHRRVFATSRDVPAESADEAPPDGTGAVEKFLWAGRASPKMPAVAHFRNHQTSGESALITNARQGCLGYECGGNCLRSTAVPSNGTRNSQGCSLRMLGRLYVSTSVPASGSARRGHDKSVRMQNHPPPQGTAPSTSRSSVTTDPGEFAKALSALRHRRRSRQNLSLWESCRAK